MAIIDITDKELHAALRGGAEHLHWSMGDYLRELDRRAADRHARALRTLTKWLVGSTIVYTLATLALVVVTYLKK